MSLSKCQSELRIPNVCKSNSSSNFKIEVRKFEVRFTSLAVTWNWCCDCSCHLCRTVAATEVRLPPSSSSASASTQFHEGDDVEVSICTVSRWDWASCSALGHSYSKFKARNLYILQHYVLIGHHHDHHMLFLKWPKQQRHHEDHYSQSRPYLLIPLLLQYWLTLLTIGLLWL